MRQLFKNFVSFGLATTLEKLLLFLFIPIYSNYLLKEELGAVDLLQAVVEGGSILAFLQLETAFQRYYLDFKGKLKKTFITSNFIFVGITSVLVAVAIIIFSGSISRALFDDGNFRDALIWSAAK